MAATRRDMSGYRTDALAFIERIGCGSMGEVYRGRQLRLDRTVAIKVMAAHLSDDRANRERFLREARATASLQHPHIVACHDAGPLRGPSGEELVALVLEYVDGTPLDRVIADRSAPTHQLVRWIIDVADGVAAAHVAGILHRDIKPENILIARDGTAKLADFGLARLPHGVAITSPGGIVGTPQFLAPETCQHGAFSPASDIYALGCTLYVALTGRPPFDGQDPLEVMHRHVHEAPPMPSRHHNALIGFDAIIARSLAKDPSARYAGVGDFIAELRSALRRLRTSDGFPSASLGTSTATAAPPTSPVVATRSWWRVAMVGTALVAAVIAVTVTVTVTVGQRGAPPATWDPTGPLPASRDAMLRERAALRQRLDRLNHALREVGAP